MLTSSEHHRNVRFLINKRLSKMDGKNIWFVDDNPAFRFLMDGLLSDTEYKDRLLFFSDGDRMIEALFESTPTTIYLDIYMNDISGWDVLDKLVDMGYNGNVILLTSSISEYDRKLSESYSIVKGFLGKPLSKEDFLNSVV